MSSCQTANDRGMPPDPGREVAAPHPENATDDISPLPSPAPEPGRSTQPELSAPVFGDGVAGGGSDGEGKPEQQLRSAYETLVIARELVAAGVSVIPWQHRAK